MEVQDPTAEQPEVAEVASDATPSPGLANRTFTTATLAVGFAIIVVMVFATLAPGPRPFLRSRVEVLGSTESTALSQSPPETTVPAAAERAVDPNDDWNSPLFGVEDTTFGDDPVLDALHARCGDDGGQACDDLVWLTSETRSPYELWGLTCGDRSDLVTGTCAERFGDDSPGSLTDSTIESVGTCFALPRSTDGSLRALDCEQPHDAQLVAKLASNNALEALDGSFYVGPEAISSAEAVCAAATDRLLADDDWQFPTDLQSGVIAPTVDTVDQLFGCFLWAPGWSLEASLVTNG